MKDMTLNRGESRLFARAVATATSIYLERASEGSGQRWPSARPNIEFSS